MQHQDATLAHIGYAVKDISKATNRFLREGAELLIKPTPDPLQRVSISLLRIAGDVDIELVAPLNDEESPVDSRLKRGGGMDHLCYLVDDVSAALQHEASGGALVVCEPTYACAFQRTIGFVHRRSGLIVEYMSNETMESPVSKDQSGLSE